MLLFSAVLHAQESGDSTKPWTLEAYVEAFYQWDGNRPADHRRPGFVYSHDRHNEVTVNLAYMRASYRSGMLRGNLALGAGTYMSANYAAEPDVFKNILETNVGVRLSKKADLWLDAGILPSHIGFESAISKDCWTLTRSMAADNSPYFEAGARITYKAPNGQWLLAGLLLNGWQRINRVAGNNHLQTGAQVQFRPSETILLNYSNFIGSDQPDSSRRQRIFHNLYGQFSLSARSKLTNRPADHRRPGFVYSHDRHNEVTVNLAYMRASYRSGMLRGNLALGAGTYMSANYAAEPDVFKNILETNVGVRLSKKADLWLDAGILPSHIGFESAISKDCWTLTRSMAADNSPYFEAGARITYKAPNGQWLLAGLLLNGWQRINRVAGNNHLQTGAQVQFRPSETILLNYSNFIGSDQPDSSRRQRIFHNLYGQFSLSARSKLTVGFDFGTEEKAPRQRAVNTWWTPVLIYRYQPDNRWAFAARVEYYHDPNTVIVSTAEPNGFRVAGLSLNADFFPGKNIALRMEMKSLRAADPVFVKESGTSTSNTSAIASMAISF